MNDHGFGALVFRDLPISNQTPLETATITLLDDV